MRARYRICAFLFQFQPALIQRPRAHVTSANYFLEAKLPTFFSHLLFIIPDSRFSLPILFVVVSLPFAPFVLECAALACIVCPGRHIKKQNETEINYTFLFLLLLQGTMKFRAVVKNHDIKL